MSEETLLTAARRIVRFIRIDDEHDGGLLSQNTIRENETLARMVELEDQKQKAALAAKAAE
jgi:hypothetical protein